MVRNRLINREYVKRILDGGSTFYSKDVYIRSCDFRYPNNNYNAIWIIVEGEEVFRDLKLDESNESQIKIYKSGPWEEVLCKRLNCST